VARRVGQAAGIGVLFNGDQLFRALPDLGVAAIRAAVFLPQGVGARTNARLAFRGVFEDC